MNTLTALNPSDFSRLGNVALLKNFFQRIYTLVRRNELSALVQLKIERSRILQCACDDDVINYRRILRGWITTLSDSDVSLGGHGAEHPPLSSKYFRMTIIERDLATRRMDWVGIVMTPITDLERRTIALWLDVLLHRIYREVSFIHLEQGVLNSDGVFSTVLRWSGPPLLQAAPARVDRFSLAV